MQNIWLNRAKINKIERIYRHSFDYCLSKWNHAVSDSIQGADRENLAVLIDNQDCFNRNLSCKWISNYYIDILNGIWSNSYLNEWVSVVPSIAPCGLICWREGDDYYSGETLAKTRKLKTTPPADTNDKDEMRGEIERTAFHIKQEMHREVLMDLHRCAGTVCKEKNFESCVEKLVYVVGKKAGMLYTKGVARPNWIVVGLDQVPAKTDVCISKLPYKIYGMTAYCDPMMPKNKFVLGHKGDRYEAGYFYSPYISLFNTPILLDPESSFCSTQRVMMRYGKKLTLSGALLYGSGEITDS